MKKFRDLENEIENPSDNQGDCDLLKKASEEWETYIYVKTLAKFYWLEKLKFFRPNEVSNNLMISNDEIKNYRLSGDLKSYDEIVYLKWWKDKSFNLLNEEEILKPSSNPVLDIHIKELIENIGWYKKENIDYLHKIILYKYSHLNDHTIPSVVLFWKGWSWKWTLMSLFKTMYWEDAVLDNLGQRDLTSSFDTYKWKKLIVEFAEVITNNASSDKWILNKLKNIIGAKTITINEKGIQAYQINNIWHFFISSNSDRPIQLDSKDKGNRRFVIIRSMSKLKDWNIINKKIKDKKIVEDYIAWLFKNYSEVLDYKSIEPLDNQDKRDLEELNESEANKFWDWLREEFPNYIWKKTLQNMNDMIGEFCLISDLEEKPFKKFFWRNSKYQKIKIRIKDKTYYWVDIPEQKKENEISINEAIEIFDSKDKLI